MIDDDAKHAMKRSTALNHNIIQLVLTSGYALDDRRGLILKKKWRGHKLVPLLKKLLMVKNN